MRPSCYVKYPASSKARNYEKNEIDNMLSMCVNETAEMERPLHVSPTPKNDGTLKVCVVHCKPSAVKVRDSPHP